MAHKFLTAGISSLFILSGCAGAPPSTGGNGGSSGNSGSSNAASGSGSSDNLSWSGTNDSSLKGQTITILWTETGPTVGPTDKKIEAEFTKETGIKVKDLGTDYNSLYNKIMTAEMSNSSDIDLTEMDTIWAGQYLKGNVAVDLTKIIPKNVQSTFTNSSLSSVEYQGHIAAVPWYSSTKHFYWNKKLFQEAGLDPNKPPATYDQFLADSQIIQKKLGSQGIYASGWSWKQAESLTCDYVSFLGAFGGQFFNQAGQPAFNQGGGVKALNYMTQLMKSGTVDPASLQWTESDVDNAFMAGKLAMMSNWEGMYPSLNDPTQSKVAGQTDVGLLPGEGSVKSATVTGSEGIALLQNSKHKEAALAFLKFLTGKYYQSTEFKDNGQYPTLKALYTDPTIEADDTTHTLSKIDAQYAYGINRPNAPGYVQWSDSLAADLHAALMGSETPQVALDDAVSKIKSAIAQSNS